MTTNIPQFNKFAFVSKAEMDHINRIVQGVNSVSPLTGSGNIKVSSFANGGAVISATPTYTQQQPVIGIVVDKGPNSEADFDLDDPRYWVNLTVLHDNGGENNIIKPSDLVKLDSGVFNGSGLTDAQAQATLIVCANNLAEIYTGQTSGDDFATHLIPVGTQVRLWIEESLIDPSDTTQGCKEYYVMHERPNLSVIVKVKRGSMDDSGVYSSSTFYIGSATDWPPDFLNAQDANCVVYNATEFNVANQVHQLKDDSYYPGMIIGTSNDTVYVEISAQNPQATFYVDLASDGGSAGNKTSQSSWSYTATNANGETINTSMTPLKPRMNGNFAAATKGFGYYDQTGVFQLLEAYETPGTGSCP